LKILNTQTFKSLKLLFNDIQHTHLNSAYKTPIFLERLQAETIII
jgi:hypothetical protein